MEIMQTSVIEARLSVSGILCADRKSKNVQLVQNLLYMHCNTRRKTPQRETQAALGRWSGGGRSKARVQKLENSRPKPERMEETLEGG
jgi:hypothetical protein